MTKKEKSITYKDTGVDIHAGNEFVKKLPSIVNSTLPGLIIKVKIKVYLKVLALVLIIKK